MIDELLTPEERLKAWDDTFEEAVYLDHKPTGEEIFDLRLESVAKAQLAKALKHRLDSPDREKIAELIYALFGAGECGCKWEELPTKIPDEDAQEHYRQYADQILALIPDVEELRKQVLSQGGVKVCIDSIIKREREEAQREERERVIEWLKEKYSLGIVPSVWDEIKQVLEREK